MATRDTSGDTGSSADRFHVSGSTPGYPPNNASERMANERPDAAESGNRILGAARSRVRSAFEHQQQRAAEQLGGVASALHNAADQLNQQNRGNAARFADTAAERVERFAETLRRRDVDDLLGQVEGFARRQPEVFIGGAFALGFLFARFIKSSGERSPGHAASSVRITSPAARSREPIMAGPKPSIDSPAGSRPTGRTPSPAGRTP